MRVLIFGHYGGRNFGDELMLVGLVRLLAERGVERIEVTTASGQLGPSFQGKVDRAVRARSPLHLVKAIWRSDTVMLGGGTIFHDGYPDMRHRSYLLNLFLIAIVFALARLLGRRIYLIGVGIGPLTRRTTKFATRILKCVSHGISVRDEQSLRDLHSLGGTSINCIVASDLSLFAPLTERGHHPAPNVAGFHLGLSLVPPEVASGDSPSVTKAFYEEIVSYIAKATTKLSVTLLCANVGADNDIRIAEIISKKLKLSGVAMRLVTFDGDPLRFIESIRELDGLIASRYHVAIAASLLGIEPIWLAYQRKVLDAATNMKTSKERVFVLGALTDSHEERQRFFASFEELLGRAANASQKLGFAPPVVDPLGVVKGFRPFTK